MIKLVIQSAGAQKKQHRATRFKPEGNSNNRPDPQPLIINDKSIDMVDYFGTIISDDLKSETNTDSIDNNNNNNNNNKV